MLSPQIHNMVYIFLDEVDEQNGSQTIEESGLNVKQELEQCVEGVDSSTWLHKGITKRIHDLQGIVISISEMDLQVQKKTKLMKVCIYLPIDTYTPHTMSVQN